MNDNPTPAAHDPVLAALREEIITGSDGHDGVEVLTDAQEEELTRDLIALDSVLTAGAVGRDASEPVSARVRAKLQAALDRGLAERSRQGALLQAMLAERRIESGVTRAQLAERLDLSLAELAAFEQGERPLAPEDPKVTARWLRAVDAAPQDAIPALRRSLQREISTKSLAPAAGRDTAAEVDVESYVQAVQDALDTPS